MDFFQVVTFFGKLYFLDIPVISFFVEKQNLRLSFVTFLSLQICSLFCNFFLFSYSHEKTPMEEYFFENFLLAEVDWLVANAITWIWSSNMWSLQALDYD